MSINNRPIFLSQPVTFRIQKNVNESSGDKLPEFSHATSINSKIYRLERSQYLDLIQKNITRVSFFVSKLRVLLWANSKISVI